MACFAPCAAVVVAEQDGLLAGAVAAAVCFVPDVATVPDVQIAVDVRLVPACFDAVPALGQLVADELAVQPWPDVELVPDALHPVFPCFFEAVHPWIHVQVFQFAFLAHPW